MIYGLIVTHNADDSEDKLGIVMAHMVFLITYTPTVYNMCNLPRLYKIIKKAPVVLVWTHRGIDIFEVG